MVMGRRPWPLFMVMVVVIMTVMVFTCPHALLPYRPFNGIRGYKGFSTKLSGLSVLAG